MKYVPCDKGWEGGDICITIADSRCCKAETNTTIQLKKKKRKLLERNGPETRALKKALKSPRKVP